MVSLFIVKPLNIHEIIGMEKSGDGSLLLKFIFLLGFLEKLLGMCMVYLNPWSRVRDPSDLAQQYTTVTAKIVKNPNPKTKQ